MAGGKGLEPPSTATTVRFRGGERTVQDGPYADTKEQLGGFFIIDVPDLDTALEWAARCPAITGGAVEVRPAMGSCQAATNGGGRRPSPPWRRSDRPDGPPDGRPPGRRGGGPR